MSRRHGKGQVGCKNEPRGSRNQRDEETSHQNLRAIRSSVRLDAIEYARINDLLTHGIRYIATHEKRSKELHNGSNNTSLTKSNRASTNRSGKGIGYIIGTNTPCHSKGNEPREDDKPSEVSDRVDERTFTDIVCAAKRPGKRICHFWGVSWVSIY